VASGARRGARGHRRIGRSRECYIDDIQSYATSEIAINWSAALAWVASFIADLDSGGDGGK
jgi:hypothetical protein